MKSKFLFLLITLFSVSNIYAQEDKLFIEASLAVGIVNPSVEIGFSKRSAVSIEYVGSYAKSDFMGTGYPLVMNMSYLEYRHYLLRGHKGFFLGGGAGTMVYKLNKSLIPFLPDNGTANVYAWGQGYVIGGTVGYKFQFKKRFGIEISVSGGFQHSQREEYRQDDGTLSLPMNKTAEWTLYKAGVYFSYRFGK